MHIIKVDENYFIDPIWRDKDITIDGERLFSSLPVREIEKRLSIKVWLNTVVRSLHGCAYEYYWIKQPRMPDDFDKVIDFFPGLIHPFQLWEIVLPSWTPISAARTFRWFDNWLNHATRKWGDNHFKLEEYNDSFYL